MKKLQMDGLFLCRKANNGWPEKDTDGPVHNHMPASPDCSFVGIECYNVKRVDDITQNILRELVSQSLAIRPC